MQQQHPPLPAVLFGLREKELAQEGAATSGATAQHSHGHAHSHGAAHPHGAAAEKRLDAGCDQCQTKGTRWCPRHGHYYDVDLDEAEPAGLALAADARKPQQQEAAALSGSRDFVAGCAAGVFSTFVGHPFDTIKVRLQMGTAGAAVRGPLSCAMWTVRREGAGGLFKGLASPMLTVPLVNAVVFGVYGHGKSVLQARHPDTPLSGVETCAAGAWAGLVNTVVVTPVELLKCRLQVAGEQPSGARAELTALRGELSRVLQEDGVKGLWRGNVRAHATRGWIFAMPGFV